MQLHADLSLIAIVPNGYALAPTASPMSGVTRRMLARDGDEVARATSIVTYAPGSRFSTHTHSGGEEFMVLEGVFSDEHGDHPAGTYVRNPVGTSHAPHSAFGCTIFVKLHWMHPEDRAPVRVETSLASWRSHTLGIDELPLHAHGDEETRLIRLVAGANLPLDQLAASLEVFVLGGACAFGAHQLGRWGWARFPAGAPAMDLVSDDGCTLLVKTGHLEAPPALPGR